MKSVELKYSKSKVDKAGDSLKRKDVKIEENGPSFDILSNWRAYHARPLDTFAKVLKARVKKISPDKNTIVAQRLKRTASILLKLRTHKTMRLSSMQDIGGLRAIFKNIEDVRKLVELYRTSKTKHSLFSLDDYIDNPKSDGYRGIHLVYKLKREPSIFIEIQVRSILQHYWATAVEVFGTLKNSSFKSGYGDEKWLEFFALLSSAFALKEGTKVVKEHNHFTEKKLFKKLKKMTNDLKVIEQLSLYTAVYKITTREFQNRRGHYSIILLNSNDNTISIKSFSSSQIEDATISYMELEKKYYDDSNVNVVLVSTGDVKKLEASYPNYFMDTKVLVQYLSQIMLDEFIVEEVD